MTISNNKKVEKTVAILLFLLLIISIIPLMYLGRYIHAVGDDYYYGQYAKMALTKTGSISAAIKAAFSYTIDQYYEWQGTYSAMFLMCIPPQVFGDFFYKLFPTILFIVFSFDTFYFLKPIIMDIFKASKYAWIIISSAILLLFYEQVPLMGEAFYWYNGSMYYTGFYALTLFFWGLLIRFCMKPSTLKILFLTLLGLFIAGANYASLLPAMIVLVLGTCYVFYTKKERTVKIGFLATTVFTALGFIISAIAPGNKVRQATAYGMSPIKAILKSLYQGCSYILGWSNIWLFIVLAVLTPFIIAWIKNNDCNFKHPIPVVILSFGLFSSMSCPAFYAQGNGGAARMFVLSWYTVVLVVFFIYTYVLGFIIKRFELSEKKRLTVCCEAALVLVFIVLAFIRPIKSTYVELNSVKAAKSIANGDAEYYEEQYQKRVDLLKDGSIIDVEFEAYDVPDTLLYMIHVGDIGSDASDFNNVSMANFYGKGSVAVK